MKLFTIKLDDMTKLDLSTFQTSQERKLCDQRCGKSASAWLICVKHTHTYTHTHTYISYIAMALLCSRMDAAWTSA